MNFCLCIEQRNVGLVITATIRGYFDEKLVHLCILLLKFCFRSNTLREK